MQWSKSVLKKDFADNTVMEFTPIKFDLGTPLQALEYLKEQKRGSDFLMNPVIQVQTGVADIQKENINLQAEDLALTKIKEIQEAAYQEAYDLGLEEGTNKAYQENKALLASKIAEFNQLLVSMSQIKVDLETQNEAHMIKLLYHMASRISIKHIELDQTILVEVMRQALNLAQDEENVVVQVASEQLNFIEELKKMSSRDFEFLKKVKLEPNPDIKAGGCIVQTNYGEVDSRIEERLEKLWDNLKEAFPRVKSSNQQGEV